MIRHLEGKFEQLNAYKRAAIIFLAALGVLFLLYHNIVNYGFDYDDYHQVRPYTLKEVTTSFYVGWDLSGIEREFYRPLAVAFYAARFSLLGYHAGYYHILSIVLAAAILWLFFFIIYRISGNVKMAAMGILLFAGYPYLAHSAIAWSANQIHLLTMTLFLLAWYLMIVRGPVLNRRLAFYLTVMQIIAFLIKEDGIMLIPTLFCITMGDQFIQTGSMRIKKAQLVYWCFFLLLIISLILLRWTFMQSLGGYQTISLVNIPRTIYDIAFFPLVIKHYSLGHLIVTRSAQIFVCLIPLFGIFALKQTRTKIKIFLIRLLVTGIIIFISFNVLTVFSTKIYQWHMQAMGHIIILLAFMYAIIDWLRRFSPALRYAAALMITTGYISLMCASHILATTFAPFSYQTIQHDKRVLEWWEKIPETHKRYLREKMENPLFHQFDDRRNM